MITQTYPLSLQPGGIPVRVPCVQGDIQSRTLQFQLTSSGASANLPAGAGVTLEGTKPDGRSFSIAGTLSDDVAEITLTAQMTAVSGEIPCRLNITSGSKVLGTGQLLLEVAPSALPANPDLSDSDISLLTQMKNTVNQLSANKADKGEGLWIFTSIPSGADLNDYTACGYYRVSDNSTVSTLSNCPVSKSFTMQVSNAVGKTDSGAIAGTTWRYRIQRVTDYETREYARLVYTNGSGTVTFSTWKKMLTNDDWTALKAEITPASIGAMPENAGLWSFTDISYGADLNDYTACGFYKYHDDATVTSLAHCPVSKAFTMRVWNSIGVADYDAISGNTWQYRVQRVTDLYGNEYIRHGETGGTGTVSFGEWKKTLYADSALSALGISTGSWTPTVSGAASYTIQTGRYIKIGDMAVVTFSVYGTFAGSTTGRIKVSGCPLTPGDSITAGGGDLSGYTAASNIVFTGWQCNTNGSFYAVGQETGTTGTSKLGSSAIYQKTSGEFLASGTIAFRVAG